MSLSALTKFILPPVLASAAVFSAMTIPLAVIGDKQINIKFQEETLFFGKLRDVALPYVVISTGLSLGAGIGAVAICGWRNSSRKSAEIEEQLSQLEQELHQKEELLKEFKLSESRLQVSGLNSFLDEQVSSQSSKDYPTSGVAQIPPQAEKASHSVLEDKRRDRTPANAASGFASAQNFLGYTQSNNNIKQELANISQANQTSITPVEFEQLQRQLRDMMLQMQAMQNHLPSISQSTKIAPTRTSETINIYYDTHEPQQVKFM